MFKKVFLDANVIIDIYDNSRTFYSYSKEALKILTTYDKAELFTSCDIVTTLYYILSKKDKEMALEAIVQIENLCHIIDFSNDEVAQTCKIMRQNSQFRDLDDTIQYVMAKKKKCDLILSNDKGFYSSEIPLMNTKEFIELKR